MRHPLSRRDVLWKCAALGALTLAPDASMADVFAWSENQKPDSRAPTPWNEIGPFYKREAPNVADLRGSGDKGLPLSVTGRVFDTRGQSIEGAKIEIWQANDAGLYDLDGYKYRASLTADRTGAYGFGSIMPGHYPARVCQHIHYLVTAPGCKALTTQLYFGTDPVFSGDPARNFTKDPLIQSVELVRPVKMTKSAAGVRADVTFEIVLERL
jgi:protocatechuate 3,4-dioxygenase beta subunit